MTLTERLKQVQGALEKYARPKMIVPYGVAKQSLALMPSIIAEVERLSERQDQLQYIAKSLHYPECWDTMAYPTIWDAIIEMAACSECSDGKQSKLTAEPTEGEIEAVRMAIKSIKRNGIQLSDARAIECAKAAIKEFLRLRYDNT